ncbi:phosphatase PAP2 family protein [Nocardia sp. NPDC005745]|uniref:phosphatase PAP2 family protein n=1 Tax=Nocardia sp. NPDC005745 TaxID=3157061 RepID=UPI003400A4BB
MNRIRPHRYELFGLVAAAVSVIVLTALVSVEHGRPLAIDQQWLQWTIAHRNPGLTAVAKAVSIVGGTLAMGIFATVGCVVLAWRRLWQGVLVVAAAALGASILVAGGKHLVGRSRPAPMYQLVIETNQSYPSGHTLGSTVVIGVLLIISLPYLRRRVIRVAAITAAVFAVTAIGLSRLYLGVHWPTDILAGWLLGGAWLLACRSILRMAPPHRRNNQSPSQRPHNETTPASQP